MTNNSSLSELRLALIELKAAWMPALALSWCISFLGFAPAIYMLQVYERVVNSRDVQTLLMLTIVVLGAYALMELLDELRKKLFWALGAQFEMKLSDRVYSAMFEGLRRQQGGIAQMAQSDMRVIREFFYNPAVGALMELPIGLVSIGLIFAINPLLGWASIIGVFAQTFIAWLLQRSSAAPLREAQLGSQEAQSYAEASLRNAEVMESMGMMPAVMAQWQKKQRAFLIKQANASESAGGFNAATKTLQQLFGSLLMGLSAWLLLGDELSGGGAMLIISGILGGRLLAPITQIVQQWRAFVSLASAWERLTYLLKTVPAVASQMALAAPKGHLTVESLVAAPPGQPQTVLRGLQFTVPAGQALVVVGPSGSGKTSLAKLLLGIWSAQMGKVRLDGADIQTWNKAELGPHLGYLPQDVELLDGSMAENIGRFGLVDLSRVEEAARLVGLHDFIVSLPSGYDTPVGRDGGLLSGGQRQRVALARAVYGNPVFVVLDEPNSSLDEVGDAALMHTIRTLKARGTTFVINSHRTSVFPVADLMLVLKDGSQHLFGPTADVLQKLFPTNNPPTQPIAGAPGAALLTREEGA